MTSSRVSSWWMPTRLVHGAGSVALLAPLAREMGLSRLLLVTDAGVRGSGHPERVAGSLAAAGFGVQWFDGVDPDASLAVVEQGRERFQQAGCDGLVALGGGSVLVAAKGMALLAANGGGLRDYEGMRPVPRPAVPLLAVPTTAGTGSEVSSLVPAFDAERGQKLAIGHPHCFPRVAVLDPELLTTLPRRQAALTGIGGLARAIEALFTDLRTPLTDELALSAVRLLAGHLRAALAGQDLLAWENCLLGGALANMACGDGAPGLAHVLAHPLSVICRVPQAVGVAIVLPHVMRFNLPAAPDGCRWLAGALGAEPRPAAAIEALERLEADLGLPRRLTEVGVGPDDLEPMALRCAAGIHGAPSGEVSAGTPVASPNVRPARVADCLTLYRQAL